MLLIQPGGAPGMASVFVDGGVADAPMITTFLALLDRCLARGYLNGNLPRKGSRTGPNDRHSWTEK